MINIKSLKNPTFVNLSNLEFSDNELLFLNKDFFSFIKYLNLSNIGLKNLNLISFNSLTNLRNLCLSKNKIEDISYLSEANIKCKNFIIFDLSKNPIRKGLEVLKQNFWLNKFLYIEILDIIKDNNKYKISLKFRDPINHSAFSNLYENKNKNALITGFISFFINFYLNDLMNIWNFIEKKNKFFRDNFPFSKVENLNITEDEFDTKYRILKLLLDFSSKTSEKDRKNFKKIFMQSQIMKITLLIIYLNYYMIKDIII